MNDTQSVQSVQFLGFGLPSLPPYRVERKIERRPPMLMMALGMVFVAWFVVAVIRQESAFQPRAVSSAGARGLLQIMPAVGAEWARRLRMSGYHSDLLFEPEVNLRLGTAYLKALLDRFPFRGAALAAYNAGPSRAERWLLSGDREDAFVERIPIGETRLDVKRILTLERFYRIAWPDGFERGEEPPAGS